MSFQVHELLDGARNGDLAIRTNKGRLVALIYAKRPPLPDMEAAHVVCAALNAAFSPSHTDLLVDPEGLDAFLEANPLPADPLPPMGTESGGR